MSVTFDSVSTTDGEPVGAEATIENTFSTGERCQLRLENVVGRVRVAGWNRPEVHVRATKRRRSASMERFLATRVEMERQGDLIHVRTVLDRGNWLEQRNIAPSAIPELLRALGRIFRNGSPVEVVYEVRVPHHADLDLKTVSGDLAVEAVRGNLNLTTVSGRIAGHGVEGPLVVKSVSGDVSLAGTFGPLRANTVSGQVEIVGPLPKSAASEFHTVSGDVTLRVPPDTRASVSAKGVSTSVRIDLPHQRTHQAMRPGAREWEGEVNGGGAPVQLRTVSGALRVVRASEEELIRARFQPTPDEIEESPLNSAAAGELHPASPSPGSDVDSAAEEDAAESAAMEILRALERGELSVDEALDQLESLRDVRGDS